jgi:hypothetical protein
MIYSQLQCTVTWEFMCLLKKAVFWAVVPCSLVEFCRHFKISIARMVDAASNIETSANSYHTAVHSKPEDSHLHVRHRENLKH